MFVQKIKKNYTFAVRRIYFTDFGITGIILKKGLLSLKILNTLYCFLKSPQN